MEENNEHNQESDEVESIEESEPEEKKIIQKKRRNYEYFIINIVYLPSKCPFCKNKQITIGNGNKS